MDKTPVAQVWARVMDFDPQDYRSVGASGAPPLEAWLLDNPEAWLNPMRRPDLATAFAERVFIVVGEAGSGKTTLLNLMAADLAASTSLAFYFDFKNAPELARTFSDENAAIRAISEYLANSIQSTVVAAGLRGSYRAAKMRYILNRKSTPRLDQLQLDYRGLRGFSDEQLLACRDVEEETLTIETEEPQDFVATVAAQFMTGIERAIFLFDNLEGLEPGLRSVLLRNLTALLQARTLAFVAIRGSSQTRV